MPEDVFRDDVGNSRADVIRYYSSLESRLGYSIVMGGSKHHGFHPDKIEIPESEAQKHFNDFLAETLQLHTGQRVLSAGSGEGPTEVYLAQRYGVSITGITVVPKEAVTAKGRAKRGGTDTAYFSRMDYSNLGFPSGIFDAGYTAESLVHSPDPQRTLKELFRVLKPGGRVAFFEYSLSPRTKFSPEENRIVDLVGRGSAMYSLRTFEDHTLKNLVGSAGFINARDTDITDFTKPTEERFHRIAKGPYEIIKAAHLEENFPNATAAYYFLDMINNGLIHYYVTTAEKPADA